MIKAYRVKLVPVQGIPTRENPSGVNLMAPRGFAEGQLLMIDEEQAKRAGDWLVKTCIPCPWLDEPQYQPAPEEEEHG